MITRPATRTGTSRVCWWSCLVIKKCETQRDVCEVTKARSGLEKEGLEPRSVLVVHGRNEVLRKAMFEFLRSTNLLPMEWATAVEERRRRVSIYRECLGCCF